MLMRRHGWQDAEDGTVGLENTADNGKVMSAAVAVMRGDLRGNEAL